MTTVPSTNTENKRINLCAETMKSIFKDKKSLLYKSLFKDREFVGIVVIVLASTDGSMLFPSCRIVDANTIIKNNNLLLNSGVKEDIYLNRLYIELSEESNNIYKKFSPDFVIGDDIYVRTSDYTVSTLTLTEYNMYKAYEVFVVNDYDNLQEDIQSYINLTKDRWWKEDGLMESEEDNLLISMIFYDKNEYSKAMLLAKDIKYNIVIKDSDEEESNNDDDDDDEETI